MTSICGQFWDCPIGMRRHRRRFLDIKKRGVIRATEDRERVDLIGLVRHQELTSVPREVDAAYRDRRRR